MQPRFRPPSRVQPWRCPRRTDPPPEWVQILKGWIVLHDQNPPFTHNLSQLSEQANLPLQTALLALQPYAVEVRYQAEGKPLPADRQEIFDQLNVLYGQLEVAIAVARSRGL
jgi:hypothetical protein